MTAEDKLRQYLMRHPTGVSAGQINAWFDSCRKNGGYSYEEQDAAKRALRDSGAIVCTNGLWWMKNIPTAHKEAVHERKQLAKRRTESRTKLKSTG